MQSLLLALLLAFAGTASAFDQPVVQPLTANDHLVVFGDSTTASGCNPAGYVQLLIQAMNEQVPGAKVSVICKNTRTTDSLLGPGGWILGQKFFEGLRSSEPAPTISIIVLGLNDSKAGPKGTEKYLSNLREAVGLLRDRKQTVILTTPGTWGGLEQTKPYAEAARALASELKCPLVDLYASQSALISAHTQDGKLDPVFNPTCDGVHLSAVGDTLWAGTILKAFGLKPVWQKYQLRAWVSGINGEIQIDPQPTLVKVPYDQIAKDRPAFTPGAKVTLTCKPKEGMVFEKWVNPSGEVVPGGEAPILTITMDRHRHLIAQVRPGGSKP
jgi:lysophospholipase L1-like esterase